MAERPNGRSNAEFDLPEDMKFVLDLDQVKEIERQNPLASGSRRERVAEHSWHLAVAAIVLEENAAEEIDLGHAALLAICHDFVERYVGDTFAYGDAAADQCDRERAAIDRLKKATDLPGVRKLIAYWEEYERQDSPAARFVKGLDAILPIALNFANPEHSSWRQHEVAAEKVRARLSAHGDAGQLRKCGEEMIETAFQRGDLT